MANTLSGIDISHNNGVIDWSSVLSQKNIHFIILKATEGVNYIDSQFANHLAALTKLPLSNQSLGAYHFFHPKDAADMQANYFSQTLLNVAKGTSFDYLALDVEVTDDCPPDKIALGINEFFNVTKKQLKNSDILTDNICWLVYTSPSFWDEHVDPVVSAVGQSAIEKIIKNQALWIAEYTQQVKPHLPKGWCNYRIWQHTSQGHIHGINTNVDLNIMQ